MNDLWYLACTKAGAERYAADALRAPQRNFEVYRPVCKQTVVRRGRKVDEVYSFLPRYLFVKRDTRSCAPIKSCPGITNLVTRGNEPVLVHERVLDAIRCREVDGFVDFQPRASSIFEPGEEVRIIRGPFGGFNALFDAELDAATRAAVLVDIFRRSSRVVVDMEDLEKL